VPASSTHSRPTRLFKYSRCAKELWKFCTLTPVEIAARAILDQAHDQLVNAMAYSDGRSSPGTRGPFPARASPQGKPAPLSESFRRVCTALPALEVSGLVGVPSSQRGVRWFSLLADELLDVGSARVRWWLADAEADGFGDVARTRTRVRRGAGFSRTV
jgi:hypothetical protein